MNTSYTGDQILLELTLDDGALGKYPRAYVQQADGTIIQIINLAPAGSHGSYVNYYTPTVTGFIKITYKVFTDNTYSVLDNYKLSEDLYRVVSRTVELNQIKQAIWSEDISGYAITNSAGKVLFSLTSQTGNAASQESLDAFIATFNQRVTEARAGYWDNLPRLDTYVSSRVSQTAFDNKLPNARVALMDNLVRLDETVSSRSQQVIADAILTLLETRLTVQRSNNLDYLDQPVSTNGNNIAAIKAKTDQITFDSGLVRAIAQTIADKTGFRLSIAGVGDISSATWNEPILNHNTPGTTGNALIESMNINPAEAQQIANAVWDAPRSAHTSTGTFGQANQGIVTAQRANNLDNLDVPVSSVSGGGGGPIYIPGLTPERIANLDHLDEAVSLKATKVQANAILAKTNLIPNDVARESTLQLRPTNPLLDSDARLARIDANISSRATPADLAPLAKESSMANGFGNVMTYLYQLSAQIAPKAELSDVLAALSVLAKEVSVQGVQGTANQILSAQITPQDVWENSIRTLTGAVDTTIDLSALATSAQIDSIKQELIQSLTNWGPKLVVGINPYTDTMDLMAWLEKNGLISYDASRAWVKIYDKDDTLVMEVGPDELISDQGIFNFTRGSASTILFKNQTYTCEVIIERESTTYHGFVPISVF